MLVLALALLLLVGVDGASDAEKETERLPGRVGADNVCAAFTTSQPVPTYAD